MLPDDHLERRLIRKTPHGLRPQGGDRVRTKGGISCDEREPVFECLGDECPVERIAVVRGQTRSRIVFRMRTGSSTKPVSRAPDNTSMHGRRLLAHGINEIIEREVVVH